MDAAVSASSRYEVRRVSLAWHRRMRNMAVTVVTAWFAESAGPTWFYRCEIVDRDSGETKLAIENVNDIAHDYVREVESDLEILGRDQFEQKWLTRSR